MTNATCRTNSRWSFCDNRRVWTAVAIVLTAALLIVTPKVLAQSAAETDRREALPEIPEIVVTGGTMPAVEVGLSGSNNPGADLPSLPSPELVETSLPNAAEVPLSGWNSLGNDHADAADGLDQWQHEKRADALWSAAHLHLHSGKQKRAFREMKAAATAAHNAGQVFRAAQANLRAAHLAAGLDRIDEARRLLDRVRELKDSPRVTARQRELLNVEVDEPFGFIQA